MGCVFMWVVLDRVNGEWPVVNGQWSIRDILSRFDSRRVVR